MDIEEQIDALASDLAERLTFLLLRADELGSRSWPTGPLRLSPYHSGYGLFGDWKKGKPQVPDDR